MTPAKAKKDALNIAISAEVVRGPLSDGDLSKRFSMKMFRHDGGVAQLVEQGTFNP